MNENLTAKGHLLIVLYGPDGGVKETREVDNLVVTTGKNWAAARYTSTPPAAMSHMAIGTDATAAAVGNTTLGVEAGRVALTQQTAANNVATYEATFGAGVGTGAIVEAGIFNAAAAGTMLNRATFAVVNKGAADVMAIVWTVTQN